MADNDDVHVAPQGGPPTNKARLTLRLYEGKEDAAAAQDFVMKVDSYKAVARRRDSTGGELCHDPWVTGRQVAP